MKNVTVYIGTIKRCLNYTRYKEDGEESYIPDMQIGKLEMGFNLSNTEEINNQAILIKSKNNYHQFKLTNSFVDNLKIVFNSKNSALIKEPKQDDDIFVEETTLIPYYEEQPKSLSLRKLKKDILMDPRIKTGINH